MFSGELRTFLGWVNPWTINKKKTCRRRQKESGTTRIRNKVRRHKNWKSQRAQGLFIPSGLPWWDLFFRWLHCSPGFFSAFHNLRNHHCCRVVIPSVRRWRRLLVEQTWVGVIKSSRGNDKSPDQVILKTIGM